MPQERRHSRERPVPDRLPRQPDDRCVVTHEPDVPLGVHPDLGEGGTIQSRHCRAIGREVDAQGEAQREPDQGAVGDDQHSCAKNDRRRVSDAARRGRAPSSSPPREASTAPRPFRRAIGIRDLRSEGRLRPPLVLGPRSSMTRCFDDRQPAGVDDSTRGALRATTVLAPVRLRAVGRGGAVAACSVLA